MRMLIVGGMRWLLLVLFAVQLVACGGGGASQGEKSDIRVAGSSAGVTPFISFLQLQGVSVDQLASIRFEISPKPGSISKPVNVSYPLAELVRRGYRASADSLVVPVFGLYAGYENQVSLTLSFNDHSTQALSVSVVTADYTDTAGNHDHPVIRKKRTATDGALGFDYFFIRSGTTTPVIIDTDGEIRWIGVGSTNSLSSTFSGNAFLVGDPASTKLTRFELDGTVTTTSVASATGTAFHHNIDPGKQGLLITLDGVIDGVKAIESSITEITPAGVVIKEWDLAELMARHMRNHGDDPSAFVRPGVDWFHINAATYDPRDDSIIASSRENFVIKFDYTSGDVIWILGDTTKYWYSFPSLRAKALQLESGGLAPIGQHAVSITSDGLLLLFNNGFKSNNQPAGAPSGQDLAYSAVSAYTITPATMSAREAWRFDYDQTIYSKICSSAYEAPGKTFLVDYAVADNMTKSRLVGLDNSRKVVFDFEYPAFPCSNWNAAPIALDRLSY